MVSIHVNWKRVSNFMHLKIRTKSLTFAFEALFIAIMNHYLVSVSSLRKKNQKSSSTFEIFRHFEEKSY
jgi:hypothetical protein